MLLAWAGAERRCVEREKARRAAIGSAHPPGNNIFPDFFPGFLFSPCSLLNLVLRALT